MLSLSRKETAAFLGIALFFSLPICLSGKVGNLPLLIPFWFFTCYGIIRTNKVIPFSQVILLQIALGILIIGMLLGPWQKDPLLNRVAHGGVAFLFALIICAELSNYGRLWMACLCGFGLAVSLGVSMEIAEALAGIGDVVLVNRWHDTIADLTADLVGSAGGAFTWYVIKLRRSR